MGARMRRWLAVTMLMMVLTCSEAQGFSPQKRDLLGGGIRKGNTSFECSSSGVCSPCSYSEKSDEKYHCSETGHRMSYKCIEVQSNFKEVNKERTGKDSYHVKDVTQDGITSGFKDVQLRNQQNQKMEGQTDDTGNKDGNWRRLSETSHTLQDGKKIYHTFRSCVPAADEETLSIFGFEGVILCLLLICSPIMYYRKKRSFVMSGATRIPTNSRF